MTKYPTQCYVCFEKGSRTGQVTKIQPRWCYTNARKKKVPDPHSSLCPTGKELPQRRSITKILLNLLITKPDDELQITSIT